MGRGLFHSAAIFDLVCVALMLPVKHVHAGARFNPPKVLNWAEKIAIAKEAREAGIILRKGPRS